MTSHKTTSRRSRSTKFDVLYQEQMEQVEEERPIIVHNIETSHESSDLNFDYSKKYYKLIGNYDPNHSNESSDDAYFYFHLGLNTDTRVSRGSNQFNWYCENMESLDPCSMYRHILVEIKIPDGTPVNINTDEYMVSYNVPCFIITKAYNLWCTDDISSLIMNDEIPMLFKMRCMWKYKNYNIFGCFVENPQLFTMIDPSMYYIIFMNLLWNKKFEKITCLLQNRKTIDNMVHHQLSIDIFNKKVLDLFETKYKNISELPQIVFENEAYIAGSLLTHAINNDIEPNDIDIFCYAKNYNAIDLYLQKNKYICAQRSSCNYDNLRYVENMFEYQNKQKNIIQIIVISDKINISELLLQSSDFSFCQIIFDGKSVHVANDDVLDCIYNKCGAINTNCFDTSKTLSIFTNDRVIMIAKVLGRCKKYIDRGFTITNFDTFFEKLDKFLIK